MSTEIVEIDALSDEQFEAYYECYRAATSNDMNSPHTAREMRGRLTDHDDEYEKYVGLAAKDNGVVVAVASLEIPLKDNLDKIYVACYTHPDMRNRGYGSALLAGVENYARERGRDMIWTETMWSLDGKYREGISFLENRGYTLDMVDAMRVLDLPWELKDPKTDPGYSLVTWREHMPEQWLDQYAHLRSIMSSESPSGDAGIENEYWDAMRIRNDELKLKRLGRTMITSVAVASDGTLAGHTQLICDDGDDKAYQWDTLVLKPHRGHGLGYSLKVHNMNEAMDLLEDKIQIRTWNAESNEHMIAVNEAMGYRHAANLGEYIKRFD